MKTLKLEYYITIIILMFSSSVYSQSDTGHTYYTKDLSIIYNQTPDSISKIKSVSGTKLSLSKTINKNKVISFLNDSLISVSNKEISNLLLNINNIDSVRIKKGSKVGAGLALGAMGGLFMGLMIGYAIMPQSSSSSMSSSSFMSSGSFMSNIYPLSGALGGLLIGMGIGAGVGASATAYKTIDLNKHNNDKRLVFESIFKAERIKKIRSNW